MMRNTYGIVQVLPGARRKPKRFSFVMVWKDLDSSKKPLWAKTAKIPISGPAEAELVES
jgi:hypothetical protein